MRRGPVILLCCLFFGIGYGWGIGDALTADADVTCDHRGFDHIQRHGGKLADDYYHISKHEPTTCDTDTNDGHTPADDDPNEEKHHQIDPKDDPLVDHGNDKSHKGKGSDIPHNDTPGIGCHWTRCG